MISKNNQQGDVNAGVVSRFDQGKAISSLRNGTNVNQIRGINVANATGSGIPKHVTNVNTSLANATTGSTTTVTVTFRRDPTDKTFSGVAVLVKGYQGNPSPVQLASGSDSPINFIVNNTGESLSLTVQATGNGGAAPLGTAPTVGISLPKNSAGGTGTTTINSALTLKTNGVANGSQVALNLKNGSNISLSNSAGDVTITASVPTLPVFKTNGTNNASQSTLNLKNGSNITITDGGGGDITIAASGGAGTPGGSSGDIQYNNAGAFGGVTIVPAANGGTAPATPAGLGYMFGGLPVSSIITETGAFFWNNISANQVRVIQFVLTAQLTVRKITIKVGTNVAATTINAGIYDSAGNRLVDSGAISTAAAGVVVTTLGAAVALSAGVYYFAWSSTNTTTTSAASYATFTTQVALMNTATPRYATAANTTSAGVLPATLGALSAFSSVNVPLVLFEP